MQDRTKQTQAQIKYAVKLMVAWHGKTTARFDLPDYALSWWEKICHEARHWVQSFVMVG